MSLDESTLRFWHCPKCRSSLVRRTDALICLGPECRLRYEIRQDIPVMLIDQATVLPADEWKTLTESMPQTNS